MAIDYGIVTYADSADVVSYNDSVPNNRIAVLASFPNRPMAEQALDQIIWADNYLVNPTRIDQKVKQNGTNRIGTTIRVRGIQDSRIFYEPKRMFVVQWDDTGSKQDVMSDTLLTVRDDVEAALDLLDTNPWVSR